MVSKTDQPSARQHQVGFGGLPEHPFWGHLSPSSIHLPLWILWLGVTNRIFAQHSLLWRSSRLHTCLSIHATNAAFRTYASSLSVSATASASSSNAFMYSGNACTPLPYSGLVPKCPSSLQAEWTIQSTEGGLPDSALSIPQIHSQVHARRSVSTTLHLSVATPSAVSLSASTVSLSVAAFSAVSFSADTLSSTKLLPGGGLIGHARLDQTPSNFVCILHF